jgi:hypothetical protein
VPIEVVKYFSFSITMTRSYNISNGNNTGGGAGFAKAECGGGAGLIINAGMQCGAGLQRLEYNELLWQDYIR